MNAMKQARTLMVQGTASTVGKSTLVAGLCRIFAQDGWRVAPFKAQNMALNSWVTRDGGEIGRAQVVQAEAAGIEPSVEMNPILLKPEGDSRSQVIVMGRPLAAMEAREYYRNRSGMLSIVEHALTTLRAEYDLVIIEGAGSPVELNLARHDLVNMRVAQLADAPVLLVGDIDRGGIFASLLGTLMLLEPSDRERVKALIVNKFRGDLSLWRDGERLLSERSGIPVLGTVPFFHDIHIAEEDVVPLDEGTAAILRSSYRSDLLEIAIVRLPYLSNYDEFDALAADPRVHVRFAASTAEFPPRPDLIIIPGTKNTLHDLAWLWQSDLVQHIRSCVRAGSAALGICGGYQMLGARVYDHAGVEGAINAVEPALSLLAVETYFAPLEEKMTQRSQVQLDSSSVRGLFSHLQGERFQTYQIHLGRTQNLDATDNGQTTAFTIDDASIFDGSLSSDGWCAGCYLHGLFENDSFRQGILLALAERRSLSFDAASYTVSFDRQIEYDKLAQVLRTSLDMDLLKKLCGLTSHR